jgi:hypothetical protein
MVLAVYEYSKSAGEGNRTRVYFLFFHSWMMCLLFGLWGARRSQQLYRCSSSMCSSTLEKDRTDSCKKWFSRRMLVM